ncbi:MAG: lipoprotein [Lysobacteraceae bacterium]|nr:MAG: lipoprotein [Xanthomonadaceae bacterium]
MVASVALLLVGACATKPPKNVEDLCEIFRQKDSWFDAANDSREKWGTPIHVQMAIIRHESTFEFDARPPRKKALGFIPWTRPSSAYGYAQVKDETWDWYQEKTGNGWASRTDFDDAIDFVGWYTDLSARTLGISKWDTANQYLAYHEGHGGYKRKTYNAKDWLVKKSRRVDATARAYASQLKTCQDELDDGWWVF